MQPPTSTCIKSLTMSLDPVSLAYIHIYLYLGRPECQADTTVGHSSAELRLGQNLLEIPVQGMNTYCNMTCAHLLVSMRVMNDLFIRTRSVRSMQHKTPCLLQVGMRLP